MKIKKISYYIIVILIASGVILISKEFSAPGQRTVEGNSNTLPDHITSITGTTLPQAVLQSRQQEKGGVRVTDTLGNVIWVSTDSPIQTVFIIQGKAEVEDIENLEEGLEMLQGKIPDLGRIYNVESSGPTNVSFNINATNHAEISALIYETSLELFKIQSTSTWVIDLTNVPGDYTPQVEEALDEATTE
jgi:hypothetical protein